MVKIILVMPATNANSECTFSALRKVKSYLYTTMSNNRLNQSSYDIIIYKELVKELNLKQVTNDFVDRVERAYPSLATFPHSSNRCGEMPLTLSLNINSCASHIMSKLLFFQL